MSEDEIKQRVRESIKEHGKIDDEYEDEFIDLLDVKYAPIMFDDNRVQLTRMQVEGFRIVKKLELKFPQPATILRGNNSKGKSSFIEAIRFNLLGRRKGNPLVTDYINRDFNKLKTSGYWSKNQSIYEVYREMEMDGREYIGHTTPNIVEHPEERTHSQSERQTQSEVNELIGFKPLHERGFDRFDVFSLFSLHTGNLRAFYNCDDTRDLLEVLFGITLTNVERAVNNELDECRLSEEEKEAKGRLFERRQRAENLSEDIRQLRKDQEGVEDEIAQKLERREELSRLLEDKESVSRDLSRKIDIKDEVSTLQDRLEEKEDEFREIKQDHSKLMSESVTEEIAPALQEMEQLVSVPNQCPICTNDVSPVQQKKFYNDADCPLCGKEVPDNRYESVSEVDREGEVLEQEKRQERLEQLRGRRRTVRGELDFLERQIEEKREDLRQLEGEEEESDFAEYKQRKQRLDQELERLRRESRTIQLNIETNQERLHKVALQIHDLLKVNDERQWKEQRRNALEAFKRIISEERNEARQRLQGRLRRRMENLLDIFSQGIFADATGVTFKRDSYNFTVHTTERSHLEPRLLEETNAELNLHMLLFHTAVLAELEEELETVPLKLFLIDSPYGNEHDEDNSNDISNFLSKIPNILDGYQVVVTMADSKVAGQEKLYDSYEFVPMTEHVEFSDRD